MKMNVAKVDFEMGIIPSEIDKLRNDLILLGHNWAQANSLAVDKYIEIKIKAVKLKQIAMARVPYNTAVPKQPSRRPTQTAWRKAGLNVSNL